MPSDKSTIGTRQGKHRRLNSSELWKFRPVGFPAAAIRSFKENNEGVTAIEYGLIAVAVAVLIVAVFYNKGGFIDALKGKFSELTTKVSGATLS